MRLPISERLEAPDRTFVGHRDILTRSAARYLFVAPHVKGSVLDIGCGRGYGLDAIKTRAARAVGVDVSPEFLLDARARYATAALVNASGDTLPFASASFDSIIAFEVIEHIRDDAGFLQEIKRIARQDAFIAISSPNRLVSSGQCTTPLNRFHVREYCADELQALLSRTFAWATMYGQVEGVSGTSPRSTLSRLINRVPVRWKYLLPAYMQDLFSVTMRSPLKLEDTRFEREGLETAHTFVALARR